MKILIIKLNATGDVVRTSTLLRCLNGEITWITAANNIVLFKDQVSLSRCIAWESRSLVIGEKFDLVISLEDEREVAELVSRVSANRIFGAYLDSSTDTVRYTADSHKWFDLSLISVFGREQADHLKFKNRNTYQELIFQGLGLEFKGERCVLPNPTATNLKGDVAIAPVAGPVWPMKNWAYYDQLKLRLEAKGLLVNVLPRRTSMLEHLGDVANHKCLVGGDSLPMHMALGLEIPCVTLFNCTSPWEIYDYGIQTKIISPLLEKYFYKRGFEVEATTAITVEQVYHAVLEKL
jgi:ADP-heptose:LPS heptosyltransferase